MFTWKMPEVNDSTRREDLGRCVVIPNEGKKIEDVAISIIKASLCDAGSPGLAILAAMEHASSGEELFSEQDAKYVHDALCRHRRMSIEYWKGRSVMLYFRVTEKDEMFISLNAWMDRSSIVTPMDAVNSLTNVLQVASA